MHNFFTFSKVVYHLKDETEDFDEVMRFFPVTDPGPPVFYLSLGGSIIPAAPPILPFPVKSGSDALESRDVLDILLISPVKPVPSFSR